jgi:hypothetical protein
MGCLRRIAGRSGLVVVFALFLCGVQVSPVRGEVSQRSSTMPATPVTALTTSPHGGKRSLSIFIVQLPPGVAGSVYLVGPQVHSHFSTSIKFAGVRDGTYRVSAADVTHDGSTYAANVQLCNPESRRLCPPLVNGSPGRAPRVESLFAHPRHPSWDFVCSRRPCTNQRIPRVPATPSTPTVVVTEGHPR